MDILKLGSTGDKVKQLLKCLHLIPDGIFGEITKEAVIQFQSSNNLTPDGIVGVATWGKLTPLYSSRKVNDIILHCTATPDGRDVTVDLIRKQHKALGWSDIGYHFVIYRDGSVHKGRDVSIVGAHCQGHNAHSIGISYVGGLAKDCKTPLDTRTVELKESLYKLVNELLCTYNLTINNVHCHNSYTNKKACPSFKLEKFKQEYEDYFK